MYSNVAFLVLPVVIGVATGFFLSYSYFDGPTYDDDDDDALITIQSVPAQNTDALVASHLIKGGSPFLGNVNASITMVEWGDYQCTFCFLFHNDTLEHIKTHYVDTGILRIVFKDFPLNGPDSVLAATASHCANDQSKYWEYHDILYNNWGGEKTGWITHEILYSFADQIGLDKPLFVSCVNEQTYTLHVESLYESGRDVGIDATPSFLIFNDVNVIKIRGNQPLDVFIDAIEQLSQDDL